MKITDCIKDKRFLCFAGGFAAATYGVRFLKREKARSMAVNGLAKGIKLKNDALETFKNMREEAEDICYDASNIAEEA